MENNKINLIKNYNYEESTKLTNNIKSNNFVFDNYFTKNDFYNKNFTDGLKKIFSKK